MSFEDKKKLEEITKEIKAVREKLSSLEAEKNEVSDRLQFEREKRFISILTTEVVDALAPEHTRTSCDDVNPTNEIRCTRCALIYALKYKSFPDPAMDFNFSITGI